MQSEIISRLRTIIAEAEADIAQDYADAETTGERPDLHDNEITLSLEYAKALEAALSDAEPVGYTDASELSNDTGHGLFAYAQSDTSWLVGNPIALYTAAPAPSVAVKATPEALEQFTAYFVKNYPGPDTVIFDPKWHAPKIFRAAVSALSAQVQDESEIVDCLLAGKPFVFDPATNFCHADDGGAPEHGIKYVPAAQVQDVAGLESNPVTLRWWCQQLLDIIENHDISHDSCDEEIALINDIRASVDPAGPAKQEGGESKPVHKPAVNSGESGDE